MKICIPSYKRSELISQRTLAQIPPSLYKDVIVFVRVGELDKYKTAIKIPVTVIGIDVKSMSQTRYEIGKYCHDIGETVFVTLDDDLKFFRRKDPSTVELVTATVGDIHSMFAAMRRYLSKFAHVGVSARQGNNTVGIGSADILIAHNTRIMRAAGFQVKPYLEVEYGRVESMEDFDIALQILRNGHRNINLYWWAQDQGMTNAPGGYSDYRTHEFHAMNAMKLQHFHPAFVSLVEKENKTGGSFGKRMEVRIQWKAAYDEGQSVQRSREYDRRNVRQGTSPVGGLRGTGGNPEREGNSSSSASDIDMEGSNQKSPIKQGSSV